VYIVPYGNSACLHIGLLQTSQRADISSNGFRCLRAPLFWSSDVRCRFENPPRRGHGHKIKGFGLVSISGKSRVSVSSQTES